LILNSLKTNVPDEIRGCLHQNHREGIGMAEACNEL
jgi:hypothetical protein